MGDENEKASGAGAHGEDDSEELGLYSSIFAAVKGELAPEEASARLREWAKVLSYGKRYLDEVLPATLASALRSSAVMPHPSLGLPHLMEVVNAWEKDGA